MHNLNEIWLPIKGFSSHEVSNMGNIRNSKGKILTPFKRWAIRVSGDKKPKSCTIRIKGEFGTKTMTVHFLVLSTFSPTFKTDVTIDHKDRNPFNNKLSNLKWANRVEQNLNRVHIRTPVRKISMDELNSIFIRSKNELMVDICKEFDISPTDINRVLRYMHPEY